MNLHEYQAKALMRQYGLPVLAGKVCSSSEEARQAAEALRTPAVVVKAQVHAGGRGKGGGIKIAKSPDEAAAHARQLLGTRLVTPQTGAQGRPVHQVYVEAGCRIQNEYYLSMLVDRAARDVAIVASRAGGMDIEEAAARDPAAISTTHIDPESGIAKKHVGAVAAHLGLQEEQPQLETLLEGLYRLFVEKDLSLVEINPLIRSEDGAMYILDAKCAVDDNALFRQSELAAEMDYSQLDPREVEAGKYGLSYIGLAGSIGVMVNGAGLAMATMDIIKQFGGSPANFLDVGGAASRETVSAAFRILASDEQVQAILINIFGGIVRCDLVAEGIVAAAKELHLRVPLVVRLQGTNVKEGRAILDRSGLTITSAEAMDEAAALVVKAAGGAGA